ncbi:LysR family transcriptional regulator [Kordiimonas sp. SCSIO 12603]|uniref:LysR family transcriptional regulator n=1 Tax=Kordiimonas sp. SCSIO 12603 TaxID=2829596 RepID=UPI002106679F|nr:LysR family transcriptional regulator [Kordiimonas sp. SCSIO 12603]UTW60080.1 LysR family transcriptional regulator [Kordiimonas sp. SCSIO 12603]
MFDWNDIRYFLELARRGKLSSAALRLGVDHTTVARRIKALEEELGVSLFERENRAYKLSDDGRRLLTHAEKLEASSLELLHDITPESTGPIGTIRLASPEAVGSQFLARHMQSFHAHNPGIALELVAETRHLSLTKREADAAIVLAKPQHGRVVSEKLGDYRLRLYAAPAYLQKHPPIVRLTDLQQHQFIWYVDDLLPVPELQMLDKAITEPNIIFRTTSVTGQAHAAEAGLGIALLPCFVADRMKSLTTVLPREISVIRELWLTMHAELAERPHLIKMRDFLTALIASERRTLVGER